MNCRVLHIFDNANLASGTAAQVQSSGFCQTRHVHFIEIGQSDNITGELKLLPLYVVRRFCDELSTALHKHQNKTVVVCLESQDIASWETSCFLMGAHLVWMQGEPVEVAINVVTGLQTTVKPELPSAFVDGLTALGHARDLGWIAADLDEPTFDIEMSMHYAQPSNGNIHTLVPGRLLLFPTPEPLSDNQTWTDICEPDMPTDRRFSAGYLAELLSELGVRVVVCADECSAADSAAFLAQGLDVHDLHLDPHRPSTLRAMDRLLTLARAAAPGAVAVFRGGGGGGGGPEWPGLAGALAAAQLVGSFGFDAAAADAWVRMLSPAALPS
jgi:hypothetical protein